MKPSRAMITGELSWGWIAFVYAWAGSGLWPFGESYLHIALDKRGLDELWSLAVGLPALALMFFSAREWLVAHNWAGGRPWSIAELESSARMRGRLCMALLFSWLYVVYAALAMGGRFSPITAVSLGGVFFMSMFWLENRRVQRDIKKQTTSLIART